MAGRIPAQAIVIIDVTMDFGRNWNSDHTQTTQAGEYDLFSVLLHELTHGLGILSLTTSNGTPQFSGKLSTWDNFIYSSGDGEKLWDAAAVPRFNTTIMGQRLTGQGAFNLLDFRGPNTVCTFGSNPLIYSPNPFESGSSTSHWEDIIGPTEPVMDPTIFIGTEKRTYQPYEIQALTDLGYNVFSVVQPGDIVINEIRYDDDSGDDREFL